MRQGFFGGTFDPIHEGHLDVARAARRAMSLDTLTFVPAAVPPHRAVPRASSAHRFAMVALAIQGESGFRVSDIELRSAEPSYTTTTLDRLEGQGIDTQRAFLTLGADAFRDIPTWKAFPQILDRCSFVVVSRPTCAASELRRALPELASRMTDIEAAGARRELPTPGIFLVDAVTAPVSSTDIRRRMAEGASIDGLVPAAVAEYISTHGLYLEKTPTPAR
jgi:nicotinate-nucleotide adenylyltransferase